jgi:hypothetical protein
MTDFNSNSQPEGDWNDRSGDLSWNELDWQRFLQRQEKEIARFLALYDECPLSDMERLDWVARQMGWEAEDWSLNDFSDEEPAERGEEWKEEAEAEPIDTDPYTLHRHPVFVVSTGLYTQIRYFWRRSLSSPDFDFDPVHSWDFGDALSEAEKHALLALQSLDMGDFILCLIHFKRTLRGLNLAQQHLDQLCLGAGAPELFRRALTARLFDLREVCLRVMHDCRDEGTRDFPES